MVNSLNIIWKNICINICIKKRAQKVFSDYLGVVKLSLFAFAFFCAFPNVKQWNMCYFLIIRIYKCYFKSWIKTTCSERTGRRIWQRSTKIGFWWNWKARSGQGIGLTAPLPSTANRLGVGGLTTPDPRSLNSAPLSYPPCPLSSVHGYRAVVSWGFVSASVTCSFSLTADHCPNFLRLSPGGISFPPLSPHLLLLLLSLFSRVWLSLTLWAVACQARLFMGFLQARMPCPPPRFLPSPGSNHGLLHGRQILYHWDTRKPSCPLQSPNRNL